MKPSNARPDSEPPLVTRRAFSLGLVAGVGGSLAGCAWFQQPRKRKVKAVGDGPQAGRYEAGGERRLPLLEIRGAPRAIGLAIGARFADSIRQVLAARAAWFGELKAFAQAQPAGLRQTFLAAAEKHTPEALEELRGLAEGSGVPLDDLLVLNLSPEYGALRDQRVGKPDQVEAGQPGCSTVALLTSEGRMLLAHNEDGDKAYEDRMFMLQVQPDDRPAFLGACYPGILVGNAPWINDAGIVGTSNFIHAREVRPGVGRYFLQRAVIGTKSMDQALAGLQHEERAYAFHQIIASRWEGRMVSLELTAGKAALQPLTVGLHIHTNHLIHPDLAAEPQDARYVSASSEDRFKALAAWRQLATPGLARLKQGDLVEALRSHEGRPHSVCRHPEGEVRGATLLGAFFDVPEGSVRIYKGQPCRDLYDDYAAPRPG